MKKEEGEDGVGMEDCAAKTIEIGVKGREGIGMIDWSDEQMIGEHSN